MKEEDLLVCPKCGEFGGITIEGGHGWYCKKCSCAGRLCELEHL